MKSPLKVALGAILLLFAISTGLHANHVSSEKWVNWVVALTPSGDCLRLNNGSEWVVQKEYAWRACRWTSSDPIYVTLNQNDRHHYRYLLYNQNTKDSVSCYMSVTPEINGQYTYYLAGIDQPTQNIFLNDNSSWCLYQQNEYVIRPWNVFHKINYWAHGDIIMIGLNNDFDKEIRPYILINATRNAIISANLN